MTRNVASWMSTSVILLAMLLVGCSAPMPTTATPSLMPTDSPTPTPTNTPAAKPTAIPTATATPAPIPPGSKEAESSGEAGLGIHADSTWQDAFETFSDSAQVCIRAEIGQELASVLERSIVEDGETTPWQVTIFRCLEPDVARNFFVSILAASNQQGGLDVTENMEACWTEIFSVVGVADMMEASLPENALANTALLNESFGQILACVATSLDPRTLSFLSVSVGGSHSCGLTDEYRILCWGREFFGATNSPPGTYSSVSAGGDHSCAVRTDGSVECWGLDNRGQASPPQGSFLSISSTGEHHSCGVTSDQSVECWGSNEGGQSEPLTGSFVSVSAGAQHSCGLKTDGSVECWGWNRGLEGDFIGQASPPDGVFVSVSAGGLHSCGIRTDASIECWGYEAEGISTPPSGSFDSVDAGVTHTCGVRRGGRVECWGYNGDGQATPPDGFFSSVSAGGAHSCGIRRNGSVECWGEDQDGKALGIRPTEPAPAVSPFEPAPAPPPAPIVVPAPTVVPATGAAAAPIVSGMSRQQFEASTPPGFIQVTLTDLGTVWGVPDRFTRDSSLGAVVYLLLGRLKGCDFANEELDRATIVYVKWEQLGHLSNYKAEEVCRKTSSTWETGSDGVRISHLSLFDESSPTNVREFVYDQSRGEYVETSSGSS